METIQTLKTSTKKTTINPFRPGSGLYPACLAGRLLDTERYSNRLYSTITGTPKNVIVYGDQQMGKTSLLMRMEKMAQEKKFLTVSTIGSPGTIPDFMANMVVRLFAELKHHQFACNGALEQLVIDFQQTKCASLHECEIAFTQFMLNAWTVMKEHVPAVVVTIDDLDLVDDARHAFMMIQNITKNLYRKDCPIAFVVTVAAPLYGALQKKNKELSQYFESIFVGKLQQSSLVNAIRVPLWELEIPFDEAVVKEIARRADGFPYYLQLIAHHVFEEMTHEFDTLALRRGYEKALQVLEREIFIPRESSLTPTEAKLYYTIYSNPRISFTDLLKQVKIPKGSVASSLKRLKEKQMIQQDAKMYRVTDRLFGAFLTKRMPNA